VSEFGDSRLCINQTLRVYCRRRHIRSPNQWQQHSVTRRCDLTTTIYGSRLLAIGYPTNPPAAARSEHTSWSSGKYSPLLNLSSTVLNYLVDNLAEGRIARAHSQLHRHISRSVDPQTQPHHHLQTSEKFMRLLPAAMHPIGGTRCSPWHLVAIQSM
jgi:hypothetical protein